MANKPHLLNPIRASVCTYCGALHDLGRDHVVSNAWVGGEHTSFIGEIVTCCRECNSTLGAVPLHSVEQRAAYLSVMYRKKYKSILHTDPWTAEEIESVTGDLRDKIIAREAMRDATEKRIRKLQSLGTKFLHEEKPK
jgi:hypothetical protein